MQITQNKPFGDYFVTTEDIKEWLKEGRAFVIPLKRLKNVGPIFFTTGDDETFPVECWIDESRYSLDDNYKVEFLQEIDPVSGFVYEKPRFYLLDLVAMVRSGYVTVKD